MNMNGAQKIGASFLVLSLILACAGPSLTEYTPANRQEQEIITLLLQYQEAKINCDLVSFLACLHENGQYHFGRGRMVSKEQLKKMLPEFWAGIKSGNRKHYPMNREMITGNYIITGRFYNPQITVNQKTAEVRVLFMKWGWRLHHYISMVKENNQWRIARLDWDTN